MSKSGNKGEKFSCLAGCLPLKGSKGKKRSSSIPKSDAVVYNLTNGGGKSEVPFGPEDDGKNEHTKQWLHNLSTMVSFDPSYLDDSQLSGDATMMAEDNSPSPESLYGTQIEKGSADIYRESVRQDCRYDASTQQDAFRRPTAVIRAVHHNKRGYNDDSYRSSSRDSRHHRDPHHDVDIIKTRINNSLASDVSNMDSFQSSVLCDSSHLSSKCCSQQRHRRRRATDRSRTSSSTLDYRGLNHRDADTSSIGSGSTVSLATEMITLNVDSCPNLGITIVGHSNGQGDCGIFVGCVKKDGAAAQTGRFEPGDLILEVNGIDLEHMANERALTVMKGELAKGGIVRVLVAKYWDMNSSERGAAIDEGCRLDPLYEPAGSVRSSSHNLRRPASTYGGSTIERTVEKAATMGRASNALKAIQENNNRHGRALHEPTGSVCNEMMNPYMEANVARMGFVGGPTQYQTAFAGGPSSSGSSIHAGYPDSGYHEGRYGTTGSCHSLKVQSSTLDRRARSKDVGMIDQGPRGGLASGTSEATQQPFRGIELIDWIQSQVVGLKGRKEAQSYAQNLLKTGHIFNTDPKQRGAFEEHNYYIFGKNALAFSEGSLQSKML